MRNGLLKLLETAWRPFAKADDVTAPLKILISGCGSIGSRHTRNLRALGVSEIGVCDPDIARAHALAAETGAKVFASLSEGLSVYKPTAVCVCNPPAAHGADAIAALASGAHVFLEKPVAPNLEDARPIAKAQAAGKGLVVQVGYNLRFHPGLMMVKQFLTSGEFGRPLWARIEFGQYLPDWRPQTDYRTGYTANRKLGGGILLDASHELDYARWFFGDAEKIEAMGGKVSGLEMDVEDCISILVRFKSGVQADIHLDCIQRTYSRGCRIACENGTLAWEYGTHNVRTRCPGETDWTVHPHDFAPNDMYLAEMKCFLAAVAGQGQPPITLQDGIAALAMVEQARIKAGL